MDSTCIRKIKFAFIVPPQIQGTHTVSKISVVKESTVTLECEANGVPEPQLTWIKDGKVIEITQQPHIRIKDGGKTLQVMFRSDPIFLKLCKEKKLE